MRWFFLTLVPKLTASSSFPLSKEVLDDSNSVRPSADEQATCCKKRNIFTSVNPRGYPTVIAQIPTY